MIKSFKVTNSLGESLLIPLDNPSSCGLMVESVDGLGPNKATIRSTDNAILNGITVNSTKIEQRVLTFNFKFWEIPYGVEEARLMTYKYFPLQEKVKIEVETKNRNVRIEGYVESNEPNIFSDKSGCKISIVCENPLFESLYSIPVIFSGVDSMFEFPFSNRLPGENIEVSSLKTKTVENILYNGDKPTQIIIDAYFHDSIGDTFEIVNVINKQKMLINMNLVKTITKITDPSFPSLGDRILISSEIGNKFIKFIRVEKEWNIFSAIDKKSDWLSFKPGLNVFEYKTQKNIEKIEFKILYKTLYEGV